MVYLVKSNNAESVLTVASARKENKFILRLQLLKTLSTQLLKQKEIILQIILFAKTLLYYGLKIAKI